MTYDIGLGDTHIHIPIGGSWKKSPHTMSCSPPKGLGSLRTRVPIKESFSNSSAESMEISSMTSISVSFQRLALARLRDTYGYMGIMVYRCIILYISI
jgi:hypothetical protein